VCGAFDQEVRKRLADSSSESIKGTEKVSGPRSSSGSNGRTHFDHPGSSSPLYNDSYHTPCNSTSE